MMIDNEKILRSMRSIQWEIAKGHLKAMLDTYWPEYTNKGEKIDNGFEEIYGAVEKFIRDVEENCLI